MTLKHLETQLALTLTGIPTAAGLEDRVVAFLEGWFFARSQRVQVIQDDGGNIMVTQRGAPTQQPPLLITAHLDHPAFVVRRHLHTRTLELEFRGGVHHAYFIGAKIQVIDSEDQPHGATILSLDAKAKPHKRVKARLTGNAPSIAPGDIARWLLPTPRIAKGLLHTHACDDLAAVAAALIAFDRILRIPNATHVGLLFTRAEEIGFVGAIHAARNGFIPSDARLICLENSRSFPHDSPIGAGAILRVGDRLSVFDPALTNTLADLFTNAQKKDTAFTFQRKLMAGGACEATAFAAHGFQSTCFCLPLGNYHNMVNIDGVLAGKAKARVGCEIISIHDLESLIRMIEIAATGLRDAVYWQGNCMKLMDRLHRNGRALLKPARTAR